MSEVAVKTIPYHTPHPKVLSRQFVIALTILLGAFAGLGPLAIDMYLPSFPAIAKQFGATIPQVERTLTAYLLGLAIGQLFYGPAADRFGRKPPLYVGLTLFVVASVGCAFATSVGWLLALRSPFARFRRSAGALRWSSPARSSATSSTNARPCAFSPPSCSSWASRRSSRPSSAGGSSPITAGRSSSGFSEARGFSASSARSFCFPNRSLGRSGRTIRSAQR